MAEKVDYLCSEKGRIYETETKRLFLTSTGSGRRKSDCGEYQDGCRGGRKIWTRICSYDIQTGN